MRCRVVDETANPDSSLAPPIHVVAALIEDANGRVLLTRRAEGGDFAGRWEFPGGKVDPGETPEAALARELEEELGIQAGESSPLIRVPYAYPHKRIVLDVRRLHDWRGAARGREQQALAWLPPDRLRSYEMPDADLPVLAVLDQPGIYRVTPNLPFDACGTGFERTVCRYLADSDCLVQLRLPSLSSSQLQDVVSRLCLRLSVNARNRLLVNADVALATAFGIGVQLRGSQLPGFDARPLPPAQRVYASCHGAVELAQAAALSVDAAVVGAIHDTSSHPGQSGIGWQAFERLRENCSLPLFAIGGLHPDQLAAARQHGAQGVAGISSFWET